MENNLLFLIFISGLLGAFIWLERDLPSKKLSIIKWNVDSFWWLRTFSIISMLWTLTAWIDLNYEIGYLMISTLFLVSSFIIISYIYSVFKNKAIWITSELWAIVTFFIWASLVLVDLKFTIIFTILIAILLSAKDFFDKALNSISREELRHTLKFVVIAFVILPLLPDEKYSFASLFSNLWISWVMDISNWIWQMSFFNPYSVWFFVVAISAMWYVGYILSKFLWKNSSVIISSIVWWLVSSTAVTATMSEQSNKDKDNYGIYIVWTLLANSIMLLRVIIIVLILNFALLWTLFIPAFLIFLWLAWSTLYFYVKSKNNVVKKKLDIEWKVESPFRVMPAIKFWAFVLLLKFIAWIGVLYKDIWWEWLFYYAFWIVSWFADVDAITQTMTVQSRDLLVTSKIAVSTILLAVMSNNIVKWLIAVKFWEKEFWKKVMYAFLISMIMWIGGIVYINFKG